MRFALILLIEVLLGALSPVLAQSSFEGYYLYVNRYPDLATPSWGDNDGFTNGITHDDDNWYISSLGTTFSGFPNGDWIIWRIPKSFPLDQDFSGNPAVKTIRKSQSGLHLTDYGHAGDLDCFVRNNLDYLAVPFTGGSAPAAIAFFLADNMTWVAYHYLDESQFDVGWCAVGPDGNVYTSNDSTSIIFQYHIDWGKMSNPTHNALSLIGSFELKDSNGSPLPLANMQGGEFSESGELLYLSCGILDNPIGNASPFPTDGIHVFNTSTWREVKRSINKQRGESGYFDYSFNNDFSGGDEPEGLTVWDLSDNSAPNVTGQLHALVYNHNYVVTNTVTLMHYQKQVFVDADAVPVPPNVLPGTELHPYQSFMVSMNHYPIWDGAEIRVRSGSYPANGSFSKKVRISSRGGTVILGQ